MKTYFISDLHLSDDTTNINRAFFSFIDTLTQLPPNSVDALYILGDFFEVWVGDDHQTDFTMRVAAALKQLTQQGIPVYFIHGNRDFLIGKRYAKQAGITLLPEQTVIDLYGQPTLICHGDELCTDDVEYQKFRKKSRGWWWPRLMLSLPLWYRKRVAQNIRNKSKASKQQKSLEIMDVAQETMLATFDKFGVKKMIHGHTHRPHIHHYQNQRLERIVLGDWYEQGSYLVVDKDTQELISKPFQADN